MELLPEIYKLKTLMRLSATSSFSLAAAELGVSQSAVSQHIKELEKRFGVALVNRTDRPIKLTEAGELLIRYSHEIFGSIEEMERRIGEIRDGKTGKVVIGASTSVGSYLLPDLVARFKDDYPAVEITARISPRAWVYEDIKMNRTDFALVLALEPPANCAYDSLRAEELVFVCSPRHSLAGKTRVSLSSVVKEQFVTAGQNSDYVLMSNDILRRRGVIKYATVIELDSMEAVKRAVSLNMGIAFLPLLGIEKELRSGEICRIRLNQPALKCTLALVCRPGKFFTPTMSNVIRLFRRALARPNDH
jgi:DNA-binding transcriptional LysR family regulator